jgi:hypothetical protein
MGRALIAIRRKGQNTFSEVIALLLLRRDIVITRCWQRLEVKAKKREQYGTQQSLQRSVQNLNSLAYVFSLFSRQVIFPDLECIILISNPNIPAVVFLQALLQTS